YQGFLGAYVQQSFYVSLGTFNGGTLEQFAYGIEQHHGHPFRIFAQGKCPQSCKGHQEEFRKEITFLNTHPTLFNDGKPYWYIGDRIPNDAGPSIKEREGPEIIHGHPHYQHNKAENGRYVRSKIGYFFRTVVTMSVIRPRLGGVPVLAPMFFGVQIA